MPGAPKTRGRRLRGWSPRRGVNWEGLAVVGVVCGLLQALSDLGALSPKAVAPPTAIVGALGALVRTSAFWSECAATLESWGVGLGIAALIGIPLGILLGSSRRLEGATRAVVEFVRPIPVVALVPVATLEFGTEMRTAVLLVVIGTVWPLVLQTLYGVASIDSAVVETARSFGISSVRRLLRVTLPAASTSIATGCRIAASLALVLAVTAELIIGAPGLGSGISIAASSGAISQMYALILATGAIGVGLNWLFLHLQMWSLPWARPSEPMLEAQ